MASTLSKPTVAAQAIGPYRVLQPLDEEGGSYLAENPIDRQKVVVRMVAVKSVRREILLDDMRRLGRLEHEHIVPVIDCGEAANGCFVVSESLKGETLQARLKREHRLPLQEAIRIGREIASALAAAHAHGLIHCDVCPANVWLEPSGRARLTGFGTASKNDDSFLNRLSGPGTPGYLSPEQAAGERVTAAADLFGLGCILYQMATGERAFPGDNAVALFRAVIFDHPKPARTINPEISEVLNDLIAQLLGKLPADRPASAREAELRLLEMLGATTAIVPPHLPAPSVHPASKGILETPAEKRNIEPAPLPPIGRVDIVVAPPLPRKRTWLQDLIVGLLLVMAAAGVYLWWKAMSETPAQPPAVNQESGKR